jgi:hypothetical protein
MPAHLRAAATGGTTMKGTRTDWEGELRRWLRPFLERCFLNSASTSARASSRRSSTPRSARADTLVDHQACARRRPMGRRMGSSWGGSLGQALVAEGRSPGPSVDEGRQCRWTSGRWRLGVSARVLLPNTPEVSQFFILALELPYIIAWLRRCLIRGKGAFVEEKLSCGCEEAS